MQQDKKVLIKKICTLFLLCSFFLPMSKGCTGPAFLADKTIEEPFFCWDIYDPKALYAIDVLTNDREIHVVPLALIFFWSVPFLVLTKLRRHLFLYLKMTAELFFAVQGAYLHILINIGGSSMMIGSLLYLSAAAIYFLTTLFQIWQTIMAGIKHRTKGQNRQSPQGYSQK